MSLLVAFVIFAKVVDAFGDEVAKKCFACMRLDDGSKPHKALLFSPAAALAQFESQAKKAHPTQGKDKTGTVAW